MEAGLLAVPFETLRRQPGTSSARGVRRYYWRQVIQRWQASPPEEQSRRRRLRIPLNVAEGMAFAGQPVDLQMLEAEHARYNSRADESKLALEPSSKRK